MKPKSVLTTFLTSVALALAPFSAPARAQGQAAVGTYALDGSDVSTATGTVTSVGNGTIAPLFSASWATATTTPALSLGFASTVKGSIFVGTGTGVELLGLGADTYVLTADSTQTLGVKWAAPASSGRADQDVTAYGLEAASGDTGIYATGIGYRALHSNNANHVVGVGYLALENNTGASSVGVGHLVLSGNIGYGTVGVGRNAGASNTGSYSVGIGYDALNSNSGNSSNAVGKSALQNNSVANVNGFGEEALTNNTGADSNAFGYMALKSNTGADSSGIGTYALYHNTGPNSNAVGFHALEASTATNSNAFGHYAGRSNSGVNSNGFGAYAIQNNTGTRANGFGDAALNGNTGGYTSGFGDAALNGNTGHYASGFGYNALLGNAAPYASGFGVEALRHNRGFYATGVGSYALADNLGFWASGVGYGALYSNTGAYATGLGPQTLVWYSGRYSPNVGAWFMAGAGSGSLTTALRTYRVLFTLDGVDTELSAIGTVPAQNGVASINHTDVPIYTGPKVCTARKIYRLKTSSGLYYLVGTIADNVTTTFSDTQDDATYGTVSATPANTAYIGANAQTWGANELAIGGSDNPIDHIYLGGQYHLTPGTAGRDVTITGMGGNGTNEAGGDVTIAGGPSTGTATGGTYKVTTTFPGVAGTTANTQATRQFIYAGKTALTSASFVPILRVDYPALSGVGFDIHATIFVTNGTDVAATLRHLHVVSYRLATGNTVSGWNLEGPTFGMANGALSLDGTSNIQWSTTEGAGGVTINLEANLGYTYTSLYVTWQVQMNGVGATIVPL